MDVFRARSRATMVVSAVIALALLVPSGSLGATSIHPAKNQRLEDLCNAQARTFQTAVYAYMADPPSNCKGSTCRIEVEKVGTAPGDIEPGHPKTYGISTQVEKLISHQDITSWPYTGKRYSMSLSQKKVGDVSIYIPATSKYPKSFEDESATNACNAL